MWPAGGEALLPGLLPYYLAHKLRETLLPALLENRFSDQQEDAADKSANPA